LGFDLSSRHDHPRRRRLDDDSGRRGASLVRSLLLSCWPRSRLYCDRPTDRPPTGEVSTEAGHSAAAGTASVAAAGHPTTGSSSATDGAMQRDIFRLRLMVRTGCCSFRMRPKIVVVVLVVNFFNHNFVNCKATLVVEIKNQRYLINVSNIWAMELKVAVCHALAFHITSASPSTTITPSALVPSATLAPSALCALYSTAADVVAAIAATVTS